MWKCISLLSRRLAGRVLLVMLVGTSLAVGRRLSADPAGHIITVTKIDGTSVGVPVVAGQTVRDFKSRADLRATLGPQISLIRLINNNGDHVLQDDDGLDGVTDVTALRVFAVARNELRHTIGENDADRFQVAKMGEDIIIRKAPTGARTRQMFRTGDVPLYHMFNANNEDLVLAEFGFLKGDVNVGTYFYMWPGNWTSENVGAVDFELWENFTKTLHSSGLKNCVKF